MPLAPALPPWVVSFGVFLSLHCRVPLAERGRKSGLTQDMLGHQPKNWLFRYPRCTGSCTDGGNLEGGGRRSHFCLGARGARCPWRRHGGRGYRPRCRSSPPSMAVSCRMSIPRSSLFPCSERMRVSVSCFLVPQWIHIRRQSLGSFGLFPNPSPRAGGPPKLRSLFGVLVSPQEYRKLGFGFVSVFCI